MNYVPSNRNLVAIVFGNQHSTDADDEVQAFYSAIDGVKGINEIRKDFDDGGFVIIGHTPNTDPNVVYDEFEYIFKVAREHARKLKKQGCGHDDIMLSTEYIFGSKMADALELISDNNYYLPRGL